ncbi:MAG: hypothetical protein P4L69_05145, partial [Desulfosporosinus sp.]|nr:hypothetical protein [Desulfosporosinus sp.]
YKLVEEYKHEIHYWILNGHEDIPKDHQYILAAVGEASLIHLKIGRSICNLIIEGAVFTKPAAIRFACPAAICFACPAMELLNCTWATPEASFTSRSVDKLTITNPVNGRAVINSSEHRNSGSSSTGSDLMSALLLARLASAL